MSPVKSKRRDGQTVSLTVLFMLAVIIVAGVFLRGQAFLGTEVDEPLQAGSADAYALAQTLSTEGAYQVLSAPFDASSDADPPETFGSLGYPLFLSLFATAEADASAINKVIITQLALGALAILLVFMLTSRLMDPHWGLIAALLTAVSPYLVNIGLFVVSASLLLVALLLYLFTTAKMGERRALIRGFVAAALLGIVVWVDPTYEFLILPWLLVLYASSKGASKLLTPVAAILGFALIVGPWIARNQEVIDTPIDTAPIAASIEQGLPSSQSGDAPSGDATTAEETNLQTALGHFRGRFIDDPRGFLSWYFIEKPAVLWSVGKQVGIEQTYIYPVSETPYAENPIFLTSADFMQLLRGPVLLLGALGALLVWLPFAGRLLTPAQRIGLRSISLILIYTTLAKIFGIAAPQYATPLLPLLFVMALTPLYVITAPQREKAPKKAAKSKTKDEEQKDETSEAEPEAA